MHMLEDIIVIGTSSVLNSSIAVLGSVQSVNVFAKSCCIAASCQIFTSTIDCPS